AMGFNGFRKVMLARKDAPVGPDIAVSGSTIRKIRAVAQDDLSVVVQKGFEKQLVLEVHVPADLLAPVHRGQEAGGGRVKQQDQVLAETAAIIPGEVPRVGLVWRLFGRVAQ